jgi:hypothetical protein
VKVLSLESQPFAAIPYTNAASAGGIEPRELPLIRGQVDSLPPGLSALLVTSDLQGVAPSSDRGGALALLGEVLAESLREFEEGLLIPPRHEIGVLLAGDLFAAPAGDKRGATGDVRAVWSAFAREARWVAGVAGNHDLFAANVRGHLLDGNVVELDGLRIGGVSGIIGNKQKPGRRALEIFLEMIERTLAQSPDILVFHEGPDDPESGSQGNPAIRECVRDRELMIVCGHSPWRQPLRGRVLNVHERAILLTVA